LRVNSAFAPRLATSLLARRLGGGAAAFDVVQERGRGHSLSPTDYCIVQEMRSGVKRVERGPQVFTPGPYETLSDKHAAISLQSSQYVKLRDTADGRRWTVRGPCLFVPETATWEVMGGVQSAISLKRVECTRQRPCRPRHLSPPRLPSSHRCGQPPRPASV
jgi:hypothetical protein